MVAIVLRSLGTHIQNVKFKFDPILVAIAAIYAILAIFLPGQFTATLDSTLSSLEGIIRPLVTAVAIGSFMKASNADKLVIKVFGRHAGMAVITASFFGAVVPFCSCGIVPIIASLMAAGVPLAPIVALWLSSPLMDPQSFFIVAGAFDTSFAVIKLASAVGMGIFGGMMTLVLVRFGFLSSPLRPELHLSERLARERLSTDGVTWAIWRDPERRQVFMQNTLRFGWFLVKVITLAFTLESLMVAYIPAEAVVNLVGENSTWGVPIAVAVGVPAYLNTYAAVPLTAGLVKIGMSQGAALAFLTAGAVSSIPAAVAVYSLTRRAIFFWYLVVAYSGSLLVGWTYDLLLSLF